MKCCSRIILFFCLLCTLPVQAATPDIYIHNKLLQGEIIQYGDEFYVQEEELKKLLKTEFSRDENTGNIIINGQNTALKINKLGEGIFVPLIAITRAMGYEAAYNEETGILDIFKKKLPEPARTPDHPAGQSPVETGNQQAQASKDLLRIEEKHFNSSTRLTSHSHTELTFVVEVINGRYSHARNVKVLCTFKKNDGTIHDRQEICLGDLQPGEKKEIYFFTNVYPTYLTVLPYYEVKSD